MHRFPAEFDPVEYEESLPIDPLPVPLTGAQSRQYRNEAEAAAAAIQEAYAEALNEYEDAIRSYYVYLEVTGPKLAHFWGYRFANQFLPWVEPGYVSDGAQTSMYALELHRDLGFRVC